MRIIKHQTDQKCTAVKPETIMNESCRNQVQGSSLRQDQVVDLINIEMNIWVPCLLTYLLTHSMKQVLLVKLSGSQLVKKFPTFYGTRRFITAFTSFHHPSLSWASPILSTCPHPTSCRSILILSTHLRLGLPSGLPTRTLYAPPLLPHMNHMPSPSHSS